MNSFYRRVALLATLLVTCLQLYGAAEPAKTIVTGDTNIPNIAIVKGMIREYFSSGRYNEEIQAVCDQARQYLADNVDRHKGKSLVMVLDIDETCLSNYPHVKDYDFGYLPEAWGGWILSGKSPVIQPSLDLFKFAGEKGIEVFFISGRLESEREATVRNLQQAGFSNWKGLILKPNGNPSTSLSFKSYQRQQLTNSGYYILVNVGDQYSDLEGGYSEAVFKLPNPLYFVR